MQNTALIICAAIFAFRVVAEPEHSFLRVNIPEPNGQNLQVPQENDFADIVPARVEYLYYPYGEVNKQSGRQITKPPPWALSVSPNAKVYRSHFITSKLESYFSQLAPGMNVSYREVFNALERHFCTPYVVGGLIRDILWEKEGLDTDIGFNCPLVEIKQICDDHGWPVYLSPKGHYMRMGKPGASDPIEGKPVEFSLYAPIPLLEYAVNTLAYDAGVNSAIIDRTGYGVDDDRNKIIRVPGDRSEWDAWAEGAGGTVKIFRFWKLRAKPKAFVAEPETQEFIIGELKTRMAARKEETEEVGRAQLKHYLEGLDSKKAQAKMGFIREAMIEDLGAEWYNENIKKLEPPIPTQASVVVV